MLQGFILQRKNIGFVCQILFKKKCAILPALNIIECSDCVEVSHSYLLFMCSVHSDYVSVARLILNEKGILKINTCAQKGLPPFCTRRQPLKIGNRLSELGTTQCEQVLFLKSSPECEWKYVIVIVIMDMYLFILTVLLHNIKV